MLLLYDFYQDMKIKKVLFYYSGPLDQASLEGVGSTLRRNLKLDAGNSISTMSLFSIFVEQIQNILNYSAEKLGPEVGLESELRVGIVVIGKEENGDYFIYCGNQVYTEDKEKIDQWLTHLNGLSKDELKALYKDRRRIERVDGSKGAGLGLIEMARRSMKPIEHRFTSVDDTYSFFSIKVVVGR